MRERIKSELWIAAYRRKLELRGGMVTIMRRGDGDAGQIYLLVRDRAGAVGLLAASTEHDGGRGWRVVCPLGEDEPLISERLAREMDRDPDCWVIEAEPPSSASHLDSSLDPRLDPCLDEPIHGMLDPRPC